MGRPDLLSGRALPGDPRDDSGYRALAESSHQAVPQLLRLARPPRPRRLGRPTGRTATQSASLRAKVRGGCPVPQPPDSRLFVTGARPPGSGAQLDVSPRRPSRSPSAPAPVPGPSHRLQPLREAGDLATYWGSCRAAPSGRWRVSGWRGSGPRLERLEHQPPPGWTARRGASRLQRSKRRPGHVGAPLCSLSGGGARGRAAPPPPLPSPLPRARLPHASPLPAPPILAVGGVLALGLGDPRRGHSRAGAGLGLGGWGRSDGPGTPGPAGSESRAVPDFSLPVEDPTSGAFPKLLLSSVFPSGVFCSAVIFFLSFFSRFVLF